MRRGFMPATVPASVLTARRYDPPRACSSSEPLGHFLLPTAHHELITCSVTAPR